SKAGIGVVNPDGSGVSYDEKNYIYIGLVIINDDGSANKDSVVQIISTDSSQNKNLRDTGSFWSKPTGDIKEKFQGGVYFYPYEYLFKTPGVHTITFRVGSLEKVLTVNVK
ncbi:MAG: hypothetical protein AAB969_03210, partial [Patescibacteria group bacterium]